MNQLDIISAHSSVIKNNTNLERVIVPTTRSGKPAFWESGGATTNTGRAVIVTDRHYQKLVPLYIKRKGTLSNENHALLPIQKGCKIIYIWHHRNDFEISVFEIKKFHRIPRGTVAELELVSIYSDSEQRDYVNNLSSKAIEAGKAKATTYHCRTPFYVDTRHLN